VVYSINHNFNNNHWTTTLKGQTILLNKPFIIDTTGGNPSVSENNSNINPSLPNNFNVPTTTIDGIPVENNASLNDLNFLRNRKSEIDLLKRAAQRRGITTRQGVSSIIAIAAGESSLIPQNEFYKYNPNRLREVFTGLTEDQYTRSQQAILNNNRTGFFNIVYGEYEINRRRLGNSTIEDGGKYYGRGFIQLTGKLNYATLNPLVKDDIFNNPELANSPQTAAELAAAFIAVRVPEVQRSNEEFFNVAVQKVGGTEESKDLKRRYYNLLINNYEDLVGV
jgi:predicted chitinase